MQGKKKSVVTRDETRDAMREEAGDEDRDETGDREDSSQTRQSARETSHANALRIAAMAERCMDVISAWTGPTLDQPASLRLTHLDWMCREIEKQAGSWPATKLHRWIGFVQAGMIANGILRLEEAKRIFDMVKRVHPGVDQDLLDHLDPDDPFEFEIGGQG